MEETSRLGQIFNSIGEWLNEQPWFEQIRAKWDELDPQSRLYLQLASAVGGILLVGFVLLSFFLSVHQIRQQVDAKSEILTMLNSANDEMHNLEAMSAGKNLNSQGGPWPDYFTSTAASAGIPKTALTVSDPKQGNSSDVAKESLFDISMKKVNIRQAVRFAQTLENGPRPVKLRNLTIDTHPDRSGYLDATLSVSAFSMTPKQ